MCASGNIGKIKPFDMFAGVIRARVYIYICVYMCVCNSYTMGTSALSDIYIYIYKLAQVLQMHVLL